MVAHSDSPTKPKKPGKIVLQNTMATTVFWDAKGVVVAIHAVSTLLAEQQALLLEVILKWGTFSTIQSTLHTTHLFCQAIITSSWYEDMAPWPSGFDDDEELKDASQAGQGTSV
ncbi:hypothetical protein HNY73_012580 [Argiope bruennichi]|uniref:Uncharacterized protein n=1 Tax=Argiope bruennichi TaxID=94029 RepID=A0A8T0EXH9_ARGBR|nr:hypothetical protein HNY73_012580 [Argiope bruennichi]